MSAAEVQKTRRSNLNDVTNCSVLVRPLKRGVIDSLSARQISNGTVQDVPTKKVKPGSTTEYLESNCQPSDEAKAMAIKYEKSLRETLTEAYCDISSRLKLTNLPKCVFDLLSCHTNHFLEKEINQKNGGPNLKNFLSNENPMLFLHLVNTLTMRNQFLDKYSLHLLLELMMCVNENSEPDGNYTAAGVIDGAAMAFQNILSAFPPCWTAAKQTYQQIFVGPILSDGFLANDGFDKGQSLLMNIIGRMEQLLLPSSVDSTKMGQSQDSEDLPDFRTWESKNSQKYKFQRLKRNEKIDRLFLVMDLLVQTLEYDLAMKMLMFARCPNGKIVPVKLPLIGSFLWSDDEHHQINYTTKRIIKLFIDHVSVDFPADKVAILSRLINLMYTAQDLCDNKMSEERIVYPNAVDGVYNHSEYFCSMLYKQLRENRAYDAQLCSKLIESIQLPKLKLFLISKLVGDLNQHEVELNPEIIYKYLRKLGRNFVEDPDEDEATNSVHSHHQATGDYPFVKMVRKKKASTISDRKYAALLMDALRAYADIHHIVEFQKRYARDTNNEPERCQNEPQKPKKTTLKLFDERTMRKRAPALIAKQMENAKNDRIYRMVDSEYKLEKFITISVSLEMQKKYREDMKFYDLIMLDERGVLKSLPHNIFF